MSDELKQRESIGDDPEFICLLKKLAPECEQLGMPKTRALIDHINAWGARLAGDAAPVSEPKWHAPGMGEVHYHDHSLMIECMREIDHPEQDYVADEALAKWVCDTLNRAASPTPDKEPPCGSSQCGG